MAYLGYRLYEPQFPPSGLFFQETNEFSCSYNGSGAYDSSDVLSPYPASDCGDFFAPGITMYGGSMTSLFGSSSWDWCDECHVEEELPYNDYENWIRGDDTHFMTCWEDYFPKLIDGFPGSSNLNAEQGMGDFPLSEDQIDDANMAGKTTPAASSYDDTSGYEYWLEQLWEEVLPKNTHLKINWKTHEHTTTTMGFAWISSATGLVCCREILEAYGDAVTLLLQL